MTNTTVYFNDNVLGKEAFTYFALISLLTSSVCLKRVLSSSPPYFHGSLSLCIISVLWGGGRHRLRELTASNRVTTGRWFHFSGASLLVRDEVCLSFGRDDLGATCGSC